MVGFSLARNRRSPKRPSEPQPSGVHPEEAEVAKRWRSLPFEIVRENDYRSLLEKSNAGRVRLSCEGAPCLDPRFQERLKNVETGADDCLG